MKSLSTRARSLRTRDRQPEVMEQAGLDEKLHRGALRDLGRINRLSRTVARLWSHIRPLAEGGPVRVLDLACGGGSVAIGLARRAGRSGAEVEVHGADLNPVALAYARAQAERCQAPVRFFEFDLLTAAPLPDFDVIVSSLFLHHLSNAEAVDLLRRSASAARRLLLVDDLIRSFSGWVYTYTGCQLFFRSPVVRVDGPLSVAAAFSVNEMRRLAADAGLAGASIEVSWPQRQLLSWRNE